MNGSDEKQSLAAVSEYAIPRYISVSKAMPMGAAAAVIVIYALVWTEVPVSVIEFWNDRTRAKSRDFFYGIVICILLTIIRWIFLMYLRPFARYFIVKKKYNKDKVDRWCTVVFKATWFAFICYSEWKLFKNADYFPKEFGGPWRTSGEYRDILIVSINTFEFEPGMKMFYVAQWGYHSMSFFWQVSDKRRASFWEMMIHHVVTLFLITISYLRMLISLGIVVLVIHDWVDVVLYTTKSLSDSSFMFTTAISFFFLSVQWAYVRLYAFPKCIILIILNYMLYAHNLEQTVDVSFWECLAFVSVLAILWVLHCYWFCLFMVAWMEFYKKGEVDDFHEDGIGEQAQRCNCEDCAERVMMNPKGEHTKLQSKQNRCKKVKCITSNVSTLGKTAG